MPGGVVGPVNASALANTLPGVTGESARIKVTDDTSGNLVVYRMFLLPGGLGNEVTRYARGDFNPGDSVTACKTDFNTDTDQCDTKTLDEVNAARLFFNR